MLGAGLDHSATFVLCWTPDAAMVGGTAEALRIAQAHGVPILNLARPEHVRRIVAKLRAAA